jgi:two-component system, cell cycle response regulator
MAARILIIEDNPTSLELMVYLLTSFGHTPLVAYNGEEGLDIVQRETVDLVLCDIQIPRIDGYGVAQHLKNHPTLRTIPLLAVTAFAMVGDRDKVLGAGFNGYISKPIEPETFVTQVESFLAPDQMSRVVFDVQAVGENVAGLPQNEIAILIMDDSTGAIALLRSMLEPLGYTVIAAPTVPEALHLMQKTPVDLILAHMLLEDCYTFLEALQQIPLARSVPFVVISSTRYREKDLVQAREFGITRVLNTPIEPQLLLTEIEACLREYRE